MEEKKRNCADRRRAEVMLKKIRRDKSVDPAMSVMIGMLGLASVVLRLLPPMPGIAFAPRLHPIPEPTPEPTPVPDPHVRRVYKTPPSWPMLMRDLKRPVAHDEALEHVRMRLPSHLKSWIDHVEEKDEWSSVLQPFAVSGATDATVTAGVIVAAQEWQDAKDAKAKKLKAERDGVKGAGSAAAPGTGGDGEDDDTTSPKVPK